MTLGGGLFDLNPLIFKEAPALLPLPQIRFTIRTWWGFCSSKPGFSLPEGYCQNMSKALFLACSQLVQIPVRFRESRSQKILCCFLTFSCGHVCMRVKGLKGEIFNFYSYLEV